MKKKHPLPLIAIAAFLGLFACQQENTEEAQTQPPNVVLIVADDLGRYDLHSFGNPVVETPNLDRLAAEGVKFTNAYASCTVCSPTRAALLTGKNPVTLDITDWIPGHQFERGAKPTEKFIVPEFNNELPLAEITLAEKLKPLGYRTASIGKWHLGGEGFLPTDQGFDRNVAGTHKGLPPSYHYPYTAERFDFTISTLPLEGDSLYLTDRIGQEAVEFIGEQDQETPFFLYLPFFTVHTPIEGRPDLIEKYRAKGTVVQDSLELNPEFLAMVECLDEQVGRVRQALQEKGLAENTLIIFTSDNGGLLARKGNYFHASWNGPLRGGKGTHYEGGLRIPAVVHFPSRIEGGRESPEKIISTDIFPTVLEAVGLPADGAVEGRSLWAHLTDDQPLPTKTFYWHYPHYHKTTPGSVIQEEGFKLIKYYEDGHLELYDLQNDPLETTDLAAEFPTKTEELHQKLNQWLEVKSAKMPSLNPGYRQ